MSDEAAAAARQPALPAALPLRLRLAAAARRPEAWKQLLRFAVVGASGYVVNLAVFAAAIHGAGVGYLLAATLAFLVAVSNNFFWNRHWTFSRDEGHHRPLHHQAVRFLIVSVGAFLGGLALLAALVEGAGMAEVPAQAIAIVAVTPVSFLVNKLWSFGR